MTNLNPFSRIEAQSNLATYYRILSDQELHEGLHRAKAQNLSTEIYWLEFEITRRRCTANR